MSGLQFFLGLSKKGWKSSYSVFQQEWVNAVQSCSFGCPRTSSAMLFHAAKICADSAKTRVRAFSNPSEQAIAREFLVNQFPSIEPTLKATQDAMSASNLLSVVAAMDMLRLYPEGHWRSYMTDALAKKFGQMDAHSTRNSLRSLGRCGIYPGDSWIEGWWDIAADKLEDIGFEGVKDVLSIMASLDFVRSQEGGSQGDSPCRHIATLLLDIFDENFSHFFPDHVMDQQIYDAALWFDYKFECSGYSVESETMHTSRNERDYFGAFARRGANISAYMLAGMGHKVDLGLDFKRAAVGCEVDGIFHFQSAVDGKTVRYDGPTMFRTALMRKVLPEDGIIIRIPDFIFREKKRVGLNLVVAGILDHMKDLSSGVYVMHGPNEFVPSQKQKAWEFSMPSLESCRAV